MAQLTRLDRELLLTHVLGVSRSALLARGGLEGAALDNAQAERYKALLAQRESGVCTAYLVGRKEFRYLNLEVTPDVLVPQPDTETLVEAALEFVDSLWAKQATEAAKAPVRILDLCTGSGAVALAIATERPGVEVTASDISAAALEVARRNALRYQVPVKLVQSDLFAVFREAGEKFHLITANPPYIESAAIASLPPEVRGEPRLALDGGNDGLDIIKRIIAEAPDFLEPGGALFLEAQPAQMPEIRALMEKRGWTDIAAQCDLAGDERVIKARVGRPQSPSGG
jgi:release factor glutamine methyltransferase